MKKFISFIMIAAMTASLAACGSSKKAAEATTEIGSETGTEVVPVEISNPGEYVELGEYKGLTIEGAKSEVTEEQVDAEMEDLRYQYSEYKKVDRKEVKENDTINVNYTCSVDGKKIDDYTEENLDVTLGDGELVFSDDFDAESALVGHKVGETVKVQGTFAEDELEESIAGKKGEISIRINFIEEEVLPELTDAFIKENFDYDTVADYRATIKEDLVNQAESEIEEQNQSNLWELVIKNSKQIKDFPADMIAQEKENCVAEESEWAYYFGIDLGDDIEGYFKETYNMTLDEFANDALFRQCVLQLLVETEKIEPTDDEIDAILNEELEDAEYESIDDVLEYTSRDDIKQQLIYEKVMDIITKNATIK